MCNGASTDMHIHGSPCILCQGKVEDMVWQVSIVHPKHIIIKELGSLDHGKHCIVRLYFTSTGVMLRRNLDYIIATDFGSLLDFCQILDWCCTSFRMTGEITNLALMLLCTTGVGV